MRFSFDNHLKSDFYFRVARQPVASRSSEPVAQQANRSRCAAMAPKKSRVEWVDGVHCSHNFASGNVIVGTGLVGHDQRDCFRLKANGTLEEQVRARPKFAALASVAAGGAGATGENDEKQDEKQGRPHQGAAAPQEQVQRVGVLSSLAANARRHPCSSGLDRTR